MNYIVQSIGAAGGFIFAYWLLGILTNRYIRTREIVFEGILFGIMFTLVSRIFELLWQ